MITKRQLATWLQRSPLLRWSLRLGARFFVPSHHVGAVGVVFNDAGEVLLLEHVFRPNYKWGLPGGWVERNENPADTVRREFEEEVGLQVEVRGLLLCRVQGNEPQSSVPSGLGLAYYCRLVRDEDAFDLKIPSPETYEILSAKWIAPQEIEWRLSPLEQQAITLAQKELEWEQARRR
jgi:8-oxo-dGTP pyrophosphatase MutT (NUDIX family)